MQASSDDGELIKQIRNASDAHAINSHPHCIVKEKKFLVASEFVSIFIFFYKNLYDSFFDNIYFNSIKFGELHVLYIYIYCNLDFSFSLNFVYQIFI